MGTSGSLTAMGKITKLLFLAVNFLYLVIGVAIIGVGSWLVHTNLSFSLFTGNQFFSGAAILIICGILIFLITALGLVAAFFEKKWLLCIYVVIMVFIIILEVAATILGFVLRHQIADRATENGEREMQNYFPEDNENYNSNTNNQIDTVQETLECCGWGNSSLPWLDTPYYMLEMKFPESCQCGNDTEVECVTFGEQYIFNGTCNDELADKLRSNVVAIGISGAVFAVIQLIPVLLAIALAYFIHKAKDSYVTV